MAPSLVALALLVAAPAPAQLWQARLPGEPMRACTVDVDGATTRVLQGVAKVRAGRSRGALVALDAASGKLLWEVEAGGGNVEASPIVVGDVVVFGAFSGPVLGVDKRSGAVLWRYAYTGVDGSPARDGVDGLVSTPVRDGATVWLGGIGAVARVDAATGKPAALWPFVAGVDVLAVDERRVYLHDMPNNAVLAADKATGAVQWRLRGPNIDVDKQIFAGFQPESIGADARALFIPTNVAETWAVERATGKKLWGFEPGGTTFGTAVGTGPLGDSVFLTSTPKSLPGAPIVARVDAATGVQRWRTELSLPGKPKSNVGWLADAPVVVGDRVVVTTGGGLFVLGAGDGEQRAFVPSGAAHWAACAAPDGTIFFGHDARRLSALR